MRKILIGIKEINFNSLFLYILIIASFILQILNKYTGIHLYNNLKGTMFDLPYYITSGLVACAFVGTWVEMTVFLQFGFSRKYILIIKMIYNLAFACCFGIVIPLIYKYFKIDLFYFNINVATQVNDVYQIAHLFILLLELLYSGIFISYMLTKLTWKKLGIIALMIFISGAGFSALHFLTSWNNIDQFLVWLVINVNKYIFFNWTNFTDFPPMITSSLIFMLICYMGAKSILTKTYQIKFRK